MKSENQETVVVRSKSTGLFFRLISNGPNEWFISINDDIFPPFRRIHANSLDEALEATNCEKVEEQ